MPQKNKLGFRQTLRQFFSNKTNWAGLTAIAMGIAGFLFDNWTAATTVQTIMGGIAAITIRDAITGIGDDK